jgi:hypothetical protein
MSVIFSWLVDFLGWDADKFHKVPILAHETLAVVSLCLGNENVCDFGELYQSARECDVSHDFGLLFLAGGGFHDFVWLPNMIAIKKPNMAAAFHASMFQMISMSSFIFCFLSLLQ